MKYLSIEIRCEQEEALKVFHFFKLYGDNIDIVSMILEDEDVNEDNEYECEHCAQGESCVGLKESAKLSFQEWSDKMAQNRQDSDMSHLMTEPDPGDVPVTINDRMVTEIALILNLSFSDVVRFMDDFHINCVQDAINHPIVPSDVKHKLLKYLE